MTDPLKALFGKPDYSHIVRDTTATISITAAEMAAVLEAYDRGIDTLDGTTRTALDSVISKLKDGHCCKVSDEAAFC
ncbi:hypothetical protein R5C11_005744, partial [Escherichia coli]|nr:hypothetical protein [Escherichia coli]